MATNKNATIRYQALNRCFRNPGRKYCINDLMEACNDALLDIDPYSSGVKRRQIYDDIKFMQDSRGFDAPIESFKDGRNAYYRYTDSNFSINNQPLNEQEAQQLKESLLTLSRFKGLPQFDWIEEISTRLEHSFKLKTEENIISFDENTYLTGREHIQTLYNAIINKQALQISYKPYKSDSAQAHIIHPYHIKQYNNRWFLFACNPNFEKLSNYALDRILNISESKTPYIPNTRYDFADYFEEIIGVSFPNEAKTEKVRLKIGVNQWLYIKTKPLHGSQKIKEENEHYAIIEIEVIPNFELESILLSFGENIEVLQPTALKEKIIERIRLTTEAYTIK